MRRSSGFVSCLVVVMTLLAATVLAAKAGPSSLLILGPLPPPAAVAGHGAMAPGVETVPEIDPLVARPEKGQVVVTAVPDRAIRWRVAEVRHGAVRTKGPGVYWAAVRFDLDRWARVKLEAGAGEAKGELWLDGKERGRGKATVPLGRGRHLLMVRVKIPGKDGEPIRVTAAAGGNAVLNWNGAGAAPLTDLEATRELRSLGPLAVSPGGLLIARRISWMDPGATTRSHRLDILRPDGSVAAASVGGPSATPVAFLPGDGPPRLLVRRKDGTGSALAIFDTGTRSSRTVVRGEPGLAFVRVSPDGSRLLVASARGVKKEKRDDKAPRRRRALREKLTDYVVRRQLFLVDLGSGARRLLVRAGDRTVDDARFDARGTAVVYLRTVPVARRPWFTTEIRRLDLVSGRDELLAGFQGGWEGRPTTLAVDSKSGRIAFVGPPEQVGSGHAEHNVYDRRVWLLDRAKGSFQRIMDAGAPAATLGRAELLRWAPDGRALLVGLTVGSRTRLGWLLEGDGGAAWRLRIIPASPEAIGPVALSPDLQAAAWAGSSRDEPAALSLAELRTGSETVAEKPNAAVAASWKLSHPVDWGFQGPGGEAIEAWWYPPVVRVDGGKAPLIVYYYGGATPTVRRFSGTHQVLAGNGYAVLVLNPRGALGYGEAFADAHVNDWGPKASADILAGVGAFIASHPQVDGRRIGIYGGSYGGFMTEYLVSHSDRFAAAVAMYGISDIASYWGAGTWGYTYGDTALAGSFPWNAQQLFAGHSPLYLADRITTPLLLLHGLADVNVPEEESEQLYTALETLGRQVELVTFPGEDHGIAGSWESWIAHRRMMLEFFDRILRDQPGAWNERWGLASEAPAEAPSGTLRNGP
ncbi:MAG: S9 family peptidase [Acidobacteria bacterium]|nr:S9 family peptidase [Acidobacteriota bacterium]